MGTLQNVAATLKGSGYILPVNFLKFKVILEIF